SHLGSANPDGIEPDKANSLVCGATNILTGIPLPSGPLSPLRASSPVSTLADLKSIVAKLQTSDSTKKILIQALDIIQKALSQHRGVRARERAALFIQQVIRLSGPSDTSPDRLLLSEAN